jgi:hypothetical protein
VPGEQDLRARLKLRDRSLQRLKALTGVLVVTMTALAGIFVGIAAATTPGRKLIRVQAPTAAVRTKPTAPRTRSRSSVPPPPSLPPLGSDAAAGAAPAAPEQPPAAAPPTGPPVVVTGGSGASPRALSRRSGRRRRSASARNGASTERKRCSSAS